MEYDVWGRLRETSYQKQGRVLHRRAGGLLYTMDEKKVVLGSGSGSSEELERGSNANGFDSAATKKLIRKIDLVLIPWLALLYLYVSSLVSQ